MKNLEHKSNLEEIKKEENEFWTKIFSDESKKETKDFSHYWWRLYYKEITSFVSKYINYKDENYSLLEAGSGSGKASILLGKNINRTLLDISDSALTYARKLSNHFCVTNIEFVEGDIFSMPFEDNSFSLVWNIGVIEHYEKNDIALMVSEMERVVKSGGYIIIGFPNYKSLPIKKAKLLQNKIFKFIPGYRLGSEKFYEADEIISLINSSTKLSYCESTIVGNPLVMETPRFVLKLIGDIMNKLFYKRKFLHMIVFKN